MTKLHEARDGSAIIFNQNIKRVEESTTLQFLINSPLFLQFHSLLFYSQYTFFQL